MTFNCDQCDASYTVRSSFSNHKRLKHGHLKSFSCQHCKYETKEKQNFVKHVRSKHDKIKEICIHCEKSFSEKSNLSKHVRKFHPEIVQDQNKTKKIVSDLVTSNKRKRVEEVVPPPQPVFPTQAFPSPESEPTPLPQILPQEAPPFFLFYMRFCITELMNRQT